MSQSRNCLLYDIAIVFKIVKLLAFLKPDNSYSLDQLSGAETLVNWYSGTFGVYEMGRKCSCLLLIPALSPEKCVEILTVLASSVRFDKNVLLSQIIPVVISCLKS